MADKSNYIIAVDGVSGSGKSSTARTVAKQLGILYLDTGAMYRAVTYLCQSRGIPFTAPEKVSNLTSTMQFDFSPNGAILVNGQDLSVEIRSPQVSSQVSDYCTIPQVRQQLVDIQRKIGSTRSSILEGRDIGTVVFPDAKFKFYLWASPEVRAKRRLTELTSSGVSADYQGVLKNLQERDQKDSSRKHSPLVQAEGAKFIDTSDLSFDEQVKLIVDVVRRNR